jgi:methionyl aminopeptidase
MIPLKTKDQIEILNEANNIVHYVLDFVETHIEPGATTKVLDDIAETVTKKFNAVPAFKGYNGFPASICISINEEIVHGIPGDKRIKDGDIVSIDFGVIYKGMVGDAARSILVGNVSDKVRILNENTKLALKAGIEKMVVGNCLNDVSAAIEAVAKANKYGNIRTYCGHGVGEKLHEEPKVLNYIDSNYPNIHLQEGMVLALEPMFTLGTSDTKVLDDQWTVVTKDASYSSHWEVSVVVGQKLPIILGANNVRL